MLYNTDWTEISIETIIDRLNKYLFYYNNKRIKKSIDSMISNEYRHNERVKFFL